MDPLKAKMGIEPERSLPARKDINSATASDLKTIYGIGDKLSERIIKFRNRLGGFLVEEQLQDVYGLEQEVMDRILEKYTVLVQPNIRVININTASVQEMAELIYIDTELAIKIIKYRESVGTIHSLDELMSIEGFPTERIARIKLYLQL
jgi:competence ComEA-like helix-hairpin-helix protein